MKEQVKDFLNTDHRKESESIPLVKTLARHLQDDYFFYSCVFQLRAEKLISWADAFDHLNNMYEQYYGRPKYKTLKGFLSLKERIEKKISE